jgi:hypothetical protein
MSSCWFLNCISIHHVIPIFIPLLLFLPWTQLSLQYPNWCHPSLSLNAMIIRENQVLHIPSTTNTEYCIHRVQCTPCTAYAMHSIHQVQHTPTATYTMDRIYQVWYTLKTACTEYSIYQVQRTPTTIYTKFSICKVQHSPSTANAKYGIHWVLHMRSIVYTEYRTQSVQLPREQHTPSITHTNYSIHQVQYTLSRAHNECSIHLRLPVITSCRLDRDVIWMKLQLLVYLPPRLTTIILLSRIV